MELLAHHAIRPILLKRSYFDLVKNNEQFSIIKFTHTHTESIEQLKKVFADVLSNKKVTLNYYQLCRMFRQSEMSDPEIILNLVIETIASKIKIIEKVIELEANVLNMASYNQIRNDYMMFNTQMYKIINSYNKYLSEQNVLVGKTSHSILRIIQSCMFYNAIIKDSERTILSYDPAHLCQINQKNITQLVEYISSLRMFLMMQPFTKINKESIIEIIKNIMSNLSVINQMCLYMHHLLLDLNGSNVLSTECKTMNLTEAEKTTKKKIYKTASILAIYTDREKLSICYKKFMQTRIMNSNYRDLEIEIDLVKKISGILGRNHSQKLLDSIADIICSRSISNTLYQKKIKIMSEKYKGIDILPRIICPYVLVKKKWKIPNVCEMELTYPCKSAY